jgi:hypothetical protein
MKLTEAFAEIVALAERLGVSKINEMPGCWEHQVDKRWWIAVNAHAAETPCSMGTKVPPFTAYVQFNGWPAGQIDPAGGWIAAGEAANEDTFIAALKASGGSPE